MVCMYNVYYFLKKEDLTNWSWKRTSLDGFQQAGFLPINPLFICSEIQTVVVLQERLWNQPLGTPHRSWSFKKAKILWGFQKWPGYICSSHAKEQCGLWEFTCLFSKFNNKIESVTYAFMCLIYWYSSLIYCLFLIFSVLWKNCIL